MGGICVCLSCHGLPVATTPYTAKEERALRYLLSSALSMCLPQPAHVALPHEEHSSFQHILAYSG